MTATTATPTNGYLLLHGWQNRRPPEHWHHWLADRLAEAGHRVAYPQLPNPDEPVLAEWLGVVRAELDALDALDALGAPDGGAERVIVAHSLGAAAILNALAADGLLGRADRILLVSPPGDVFLNQEPAIAEFAPPARVDSAIPLRLVGSDDDFYCVEGVAELHGPRLGLDADAIDVLPGAGHISLDDGYGPWPSVLAWCLDPATRLVPRPDASTGATTDSTTDATTSTSTS